MSDLDSLPECLTYLPRYCRVDSPCPHCAPPPPLPGHVEEMGAPAHRQKVLLNHEGTQGGVSKGGGGVEQRW